MPRYSCSTLCTAYINAIHTCHTCSYEAQKAHASHSLTPRRLNNQPKACSGSVQHRFQQQHAPPAFPACHPQPTVGHWLPHPTCVWRSTQLHVATNQPAASPRCTHACPGLLCSVLQRTASTQCFNTKFPRPALTTGTMQFLATGPWSFWECQHCRYLQRKLLHLIWGSEYLAVGDTKLAQAQALILVRRVYHGMLARVRCHHGREAEHLHKAIMAQAENLSGWRPASA